MNLTFHHFKKDVRQFRLLLVIWFGLLLIDFAVNFGLVGNAEYSPSRGFESGSNVWTALLPRVLWAFAAILPSLVVLADSPARHEGFLATRPVRKRELLLAKVLFVFFLIVVPWALSEVLYLAAEHLPGWVIVRGLWERLLFLLPVTFGFGAFAALWPGTARWTRALGISFGSYLVFGVLYSYCIHVFRPVWLLRLGQTPGIAAPYIIVMALIVFAAWHARAHRSWRCRWLGIFGCALAGWIGGSFWKVELGRLVPENPALARTTVAAADLTIPMSGIRLGLQSDSEHLDENRFNLSLIPEVKPLPKAEMIEWSGSNLQLIRADGRETTRAMYAGNGAVFNEYYGNEPMPFEEVTAWATWFPTNVMFRHLEYPRLTFPAEMTFNGFRLPKDSAGLSESLRVKAEVESRLFEWRKIADLPLAPGATATNEFGSWEIKSTQTSPGIAAAQLFLERRQIELRTVHDSRCSSAYGGPLNRMQLMVYDPRDQIAWITDSYAMNAATRATHTGFARHFVLLSFNRRFSFTADELARFRLVIFEKAWIGSVPQQWESTAFTLESKMPEFSGVANYGNNPETLSWGELNRRLAALNTPSADAPRREISAYLMEYFRLLDARGRLVDSGGSEVARLAGLVPTQLKLLLEGLPLMGWVSKDAVLAAIGKGALEEQKPVVIAAIHSQPELAEVLLKRGWTEEARRELFETIQSSSQVPFSLFQAVALFHDPQTYPWLLNAFERETSASADDLLHRMGLGEQAGEIIRRKWYRNKLIWRPGSQMFDETFRLALRHGDETALQRAFLVVKQMESDDMNQEFGLFEGIRQTVQMPDLDRGNRPDALSIATWMKKHHPEDFMFSPARRQFLLKPGINP
jgi:hypothetical protein